MNLPRVRKYLINCTIALLFLFVGGNPPTAHAALITVNSIDDNTAINGFCTLREAITNANNNNRTYGDCAEGMSLDTITITATGTITLASALPDLVEGLTINGPGASSLTISGANQFRVFAVTGEGAFSFADMTIANGRAIGGYGGGISTAPAIALEVNRITFSGNQATSGGAIYSATGNLVKVTNSTFVNNVGYGSALNNDGTSTLIVANSSLTGNTGFAGEGGTIVQGGPLGSTTLTNVTVNASGVGSAIYLNAGTVTLRNTIVSNTGGWSCVGLVSSIMNDGNNIDSGTSCGWGSNNGSMSNTNPLLGVLAYNGGTTQTMALLAGSPAINAGNPTVCAAPTGSPTFGAGGVDQRGMARGGGYCDIGAFEVQPVWSFLPFISR